MVPGMYRVCTGRYTYQGGMGAIYTRVYTYQGGMGGIYTRVYHTLRSPEGLSGP